MLVVVLIVPVSHDGVGVATGSRAPLLPVVQRILKVVVLVRLVALNHLVMPAKTARVSSDADSGNAMSWIHRSPSSFLEKR